MKYTITIGTNEIDVNALEITLDKTEELDFGVLIIPATTRFTNYQILDELNITIDDGTNTKVFDPFIVISDKVEPVSKYGYYQHTITFIENIHKFEKLLSTNLFFTQSKTGTPKTLLDILTRLRNTVPFELTSIHSQTRVFDIDANLATYLDTIEAPQFFFQGKNLREMLNDIAGFVNSVGRLETNNNLVFDFYNEILSTIGIEEDIIQKTLQNETKNFSTTIDAVIENAISTDDNTKATIVYPSDSSYMSFRPSNLKLTDTDYVLNLPFDIETMVKVEYAPKISLAYFEYPTFGDFPVSGVSETIFYSQDTGIYYYWNSTTSEYIEASEIIEIISATSGSNIVLRLNLDITELIYTKDQWDRLELDDSSEVLRNQSNYKVNTLFYTIGDKTLSNGLLAGVFSDITAVRALFRRSLNFSEIEMSIDTMALLDDLDSHLFRVTFIPYFTSVTRLEKDNINDIPYNTQTHSNQSDRIVSAEKLANNLYGLSQRTGQDEIEIKKYYSNLTEIFNLGDITEDGFVISKIKYTCYINYIIVNYLFTKNFNRFSKRIAFSQENRSFDIPLGGNTTKRVLPYSEYVELNTEYMSSNSMVTYDGKEVFMNTLRATHPTYNTPIGFAGLYSSEMFEPDITSDKGIYRKIIKYGAGNSLNFVWSFDDIYSAGDRLKSDNYLYEISGGTSGSIPVDVKRFTSYTDINGELEELKVHMFDDIVDSDLNNFANELPIITMPSNPLIGNTDTYKVYKDAGEILGMNYQLVVIPHYTKATNFVVGKQLINGNNLIQRLTDKDLYFYYSNANEYNSLDKDFVKGNRMPLSSYHYTIGWEYTDVLDYNTYQPYLELDSIDVSSYTSWAIGDIDENLYLGVNTKGENVNKIYFNFRNKRTNLNYTFSDVPIYYVLPPLIQLTPSTDSISANWIDQQSSTNFEYGIRDLTTGGVWTDIGTTTLLGYNFSGLNGGHQYEVRVRAYADSIWSEYGYATTYTASLPEQMVISGITLYNPTALQVHWEDITNETGYYVQQKTSLQDWTDTSQNYSAQNTTSYIYSISTNTLYDHRLRAYNTVGYGDWSNTYQYVLTELPPNPVISSEDEDGFLVTFTNFPTATKHWLRYRELGETVWNEIDVGMASGYEFNTLDSSTTYEISVRVEFTSNGNTIYTSWSNTVEGTTTTPSVPTSSPTINYVGQTEEYIIVTFTNNDTREVTVYFESDDATPDARTVVISGSSTSGNQVIYDEVGPHTLYAYAQASGAVASSTVSYPFELTATTSPDIPLNFQVINVLLDEIYFQWTDNSTNEDGFTVELHTNSSYTNLYKTQNANANAQSMMMASVANGTYYARIKAYNSIGDSAWLSCSDNPIVVSY